MNVTFESFLTPAGLLVAAGLITTLIEIIKTAFPVIDARVSGAAMAFVLSALLYIATAWAVTVPTANAGLEVFAAWLACAASAIGIKSGATHFTGGPST
jgi:hypothetical protein